MRVVNMKTTNMKQQKGFTLIELIIVIIILGILAVTAAPKFLDISADANSATVQGVQGSVRAAIQLVRSKARIDGVDNDAYDGTTDVTILLDGESIDVDDGFPAPHADNILAMLDTSTGDFVAFQDDASDTDAAEVRIWPAGKQNDAADGDLAGSSGDAPDDCYVSYLWNGTGTPSVAIVTTDC